MKKAFKKTSELFYSAPILFTLIGTFLLSFLLGATGWVTSLIQRKGHFDWENFLSILMVTSPFILTAFLTIENVLLFIKPQPVKNDSAIKRWEVAAIGAGAAFSLFGLQISNIVFEDWHVQLYNTEWHSPLARDSILTISVIVLLSVFGYIILRFFPLEKLPPLFAVLCISALYLGIAAALLWCIQVYKGLDVLLLLLILFPLNCILIAIRTIKQVVHQQIIRTRKESYKFKRLAVLLHNAANWPWLAFLFALPLLGIIVAVLLLFGQEPDSIIKAWTQTADWNLSQKIAPPNVWKDEHYLCTVAAGGHPQVVKPLRMGKRHGHRVIVNRQLCVANAFEQLLEERLPKFHRAVRSFYDTYGYPVAKRIRSPYAADVTYFLMKPLEWLFLLTLYLFDVKPENRIAVQYPHAELPRKQA